jgi:hypothetical protein
MYGFELVEATSHNYLLEEDCVFGLVFIESLQDVLIIALYRLPFLNGFLDEECERSSVVVLVQSSLQEVNESALATANVTLYLYEKLFVHFSDDLLNTSPSNLQELLRQRASRDQTTVSRTKIT